jgi:hypothetical protein
MKKYFFVAIAILALGTVYQNCEGGDSFMKRDSSSQSFALDFDFTYSQQYVPSNQVSVIVQGICEVAGYTDHRIDWQYTFKNVKYQGRTDRPCITTTGTFMLVIPVNQLTRAENDSFDFSGKITGVKKGIATPGASRTVKVTFSATQSTGSTTGTTTGSTAGTTAGSTGSTTGTTATGGSTAGTTGTTTGYTCTPTNQLFCGMCPEAMAAGVDEYCSGAANYAYSAYCASIQVPESREDLVRQVAAERPELIEDCGRNASANANWNAFTTEVINRLRNSGEYDAWNWGFNGVRGDTNDINGDTISYWGAAGAPQEDGVGGVVFDIVRSCGDGGENAPVWQVLNPYCGCCTKMQAWTLGGKF